MDGIENFVSFIPITDSTDSLNHNSQNQLISRNSLSALASLAGLTSLTNHHQTQSSQQPSYSLDHYQFDKSVDPSLVNIKEFTENFKVIRTKLKEIEIVISELEQRKDLIKHNYDEVIKKLTDFFSIPETSTVYQVIGTKAYEMINALGLEKYYEARDKLLEYYKISVPLLNQVKQEFFAENQNIENCHICYEKPLSYAIYPCGHTMCEDCRKKVVGSCYLCRSPVIRVNKIYI